MTRHGGCGAVGGGEKEGCCGRPVGPGGVWQAPQSVSPSTSDLRDDGRTEGDALTLSQACPYSTVAEFFEKSSEVRAYMSTADRPAPTRMTARLVVRAVVRATSLIEHQINLSEDTHMYCVMRTFASRAQLRPLLRVAASARRRRDEAKLEGPHIVLPAVLALVLLECVGEEGGCGDAVVAGSVRPARSEMQIVRLRPQRMMGRLVREDPCE